MYHRTAHGMIQSANKPPERKYVALSLRECTHADEKAGSESSVGVAAKCSPDLTPGALRGCSQARLLLGASLRAGETVDTHTHYKFVSYHLGGELYVY